MELGGESIWCGASLRPWQILHTKLAEMSTSTRNLEIDVWKLVDEAMKDANCYSEEEDMKRREEELIWRQAEDEEEEEQISFMKNTSYIYDTEYDANSGIEREENGRLDAADQAEVDQDGSYGGTEDGFTAIYKVADEEEEDPRSGYSYYYYQTPNLAGPAILAAPLDAEMHCSSLQVDKYGSSWPELEEQLCAVCLEALLPGAVLITQLACLHSFHSPCLAPWLSASSFCPCCRAPIAALYSYPPLDLEPPPDLEIISNHSSTACGDGMMELLAEMEAALDRFGLLS